MQVIGDWVAAHTQEEVLAAMAEARVPSGKACPVHECVPILKEATAAGTADTCSLSSPCQQNCGIIQEKPGSEVQCALCGHTKHSHMVM